MCNAIISITFNQTVLLLSSKTYPYNVCLITNQVHVRLCTNEHPILLYALCSILKHMTQRHAAVLSSTAPNPQLYSKHLCIKYAKHAYTYFHNIIPNIGRIIHNIAYTFIVCLLAFLSIPQTQLRSSQYYILHKYIYIRTNVYVVLMTRKHNAPIRHIT